jgi:hypothetical protein
MPVVPAVGRLRQHNLEFKTSLGYTVSPSLRRKKNTKTKTENLQKCIFPQSWRLEVLNQGARKVSVW